MSANLMWQPAKRNPQSLPDELKFILRDKRDLQDRVTYNADMIPYLRGLADAEVKGAQELIDAIEEYEEVELWLEY